MNKIIAALFILTLGVAVFAQDTKKTRPRVAPTPEPEVPSTNSGTPPILQNDDSEPRRSNKPPVLINPSARTTVPPPPPLPTATVEDSDDVIKVETNLVTLPVTVLDRNGRFVAGLRQPEFEIYDNGKKQEVGLFKTVETPFTVVLMLDVSPSTQYKIEEIRSAALTFVNQLRPSDKVMVVAFDQNYQILTLPTNDRARLRNAIFSADFGNGTSLYDAMSNTMARQLSLIEGRKAIVIFTDGVDTTSRHSNYESTLRQVEELDAMVYPIRYNTLNDGPFGANRPQTRQPGRVPQPQTNSGGIFGQILVGILTNGAGLPGISIGTGGQGSPEDYERGRRYLADIATFSGGRMFEADTITNLDAAFKSIAEELRMQYSLGYYPDETGVAGDRRSINVRVKRSNLVVRTKRSYIVGSGT